MSKQRALMITSFCLLIMISLSGCANLKAIKALEIANIDFSSVRDGLYEGYQDNWMVTAKVNVSASGGRVKNIQIIEHNHGPNHGADAITAKVVDKQSLQVDAISGASYSSKVVLKAIELALRKGQ